MGATAMSAIYSVTVPAEAAGASTYRELSIFGDVFERVRAQYVTPPKEDQLIENAINGMLSSLDPHSSYMNAKDADEMRTQTRGEFGGLGIEVTMEEELVKVITPIDDTPAARAGVLAGDLISKIDGQDVRGLKLEEAVEKMRGKVNTPIKLTILRKGADKPIELTIVRDIIAVKAVKIRVEGDVGYLRVISFTEKTFDDLEKGIEKIKADVPADKLKGYVLDLRLNPGGLLDQAINVSDAFLERGEVVSTRGRNEDETRRFNASPGDLTDGKPRHCADQRRLCLRFGNRRRRAAGPAPCHRARHPLLRQGFGADHHPDGRRRRAAPDDGALLHAVRQVDPGHRHHAGHQGRSAAAAGTAGQDRGRRRIQPARPHQGPERERRRVRIVRLCSAGSQG